MPLIALSTLKGYVVKYWKPTVTQVLGWMDSYWHKEETIPVNKIEGLTDLLNGLPSAEAVTDLLAALQLETVVLNTNGTYNLAAGKNIDFIRFESATDQTLFIQDTTSGDDLAGEIAITGGTPLILHLGIPAPGNAARSLTITGVTASVTLRIRKI